MYKDARMWAALSAFAAGLAGLGYAYSFVVLQNPLLYSLFLMAGGKFTLFVFISLYDKLKEVEVNYARYVVLIGAVGALGAIIHGGYDLANAINPPANLNLDLPHQVDPRGLLTFGVTGAAILKASWMLLKHKGFPNALAMLGVLSGALLIVIYLARLIVLDPTNPILLYPVLAEGFLIGPLWYLWLGWVWWGKR